MIQEPLTLKFNVHFRNFYEDGNFVENYAYVNFTTLITSNFYPCYYVNVNAIRIYLRVSFYSVVVQM